ncbi:ribosomal protein L37AE/L43A [Aneurinibacillus soli]|uniref:Uncharacterized protein n=1 Tax=Aneurinibacillus soli TaxID=1500254 RepID=A0A0U4NFS4_9BACL|nr:ribosomal protein L37AE/L43A [Aneurinibacillus soli]BAU27588.1 hypothetical protein CB4_01762 [Aneurinibacillus soli]
MNITRFIPSETTKEGYVSPRFFGKCEVCGNEFQGTPSDPDLCHEHREIKDIKFRILYTCPFCDTETDNQESCPDCGAKFEILGYIDEAYATKTKTSRRISNDMLIFMLNNHSIYHLISRYLFLLTGLIQIAICARHHPLVHE